MESIENDYMYLKISKVSNLINIFILIIVILCIAYLFNPYTAINLSTIVETVLMFAITFIATTVFKFSNKRIFRLISICLLFVALLKFNTLIYLVVSFGEREILELVKLKSVYICVVLESIYCFLVIAYVKRISFKTKVIVYLFTSIVFISIYLGNMYIFWGTSIILFSVILYVIRDSKLYENNLLNHLKLLVIINLLLIVSDFFTYKFSLEILVFLNDILKIFLYFLVYVWISDMLIRKPYENLNKGIINKNKKLEKLNKRMEESNNDFKEFKKKMRDKENYFKDFLENVPKSIVVLHKKNFRVFATNKKFINELKLDNKKSIINKNFFELLNIENKQEFLITRKGTAFINKYGTEVFWEVEILSENGDHIIISLRNISEVKKSEKIKDNLRKKTLEEQIKNDFLSSISHDLKTPINVIYSSAQVQEKFYRNKHVEKISHYNQVNKENCITLMRLANNLIDSSKLSYDYLKPNLKVHNIVTLIEDSIGNLIEYINEKELTYVFDTLEEEIYVKCDQEFIERIIINIISNSIKHTKVGGISVNIKSKKNKVLIDLTDTGEGMDKEFLGKAFFRYSQEKNNKKELKNKSTGIGLYIVKNLVELQGGTIQINSIKDTGTNIRLEFNRERDCGVQSKA